MVRIKKAFLSTLEIIFTSVALFFIVNIFLAELLIVTGDSMLPNLHNGEQILNEKISLKFKEIERSEIIVFESPKEEGKLLIKRVIALPGETVLLKSGHLYVNNIMLNEPYLNEKTETYEGKYLKENTEYTLPTGSYLLLGDNRTNSDDSRNMGFISKENIVGRPVLVYYPLNSIRIIKR